MLIISRYVRRVPLRTFTSVCVSVWLSMSVHFSICSLCFCVCICVSVCLYVFMSVCVVLDVAAFERVLGPCMDIMKRSIDAYEEQLVHIFGSKAAITDLR